MHHVHFHVDRDRVRRPAPAGRTRSPIHGPQGAVAVLVDCRNIRLAARETIGAADVSYEALLVALRPSFRRIELHLFAATSDLPDLEAMRPPTWATIRAHPKRCPGRNVDQEVCFWAARNVSPARYAAVLVVSGDGGFLALEVEARRLGVRVAFLLPPGRAASRLLLAAPHAFLGTDVLGPAVVRHHHPVPRPNASWFDAPWRWASRGRERVIWRASDAA